MSDLTTSPASNLETASREALEALFDAGVFEEHLALTFEGFDDAELEAEVHGILLEYGATQQSEDTYQFPDLDRLRSFMNAVADELEGESDDLEQAAVNADEFIVFDDLPWHIPEADALPDRETETLQLPARGYQLRKVAFSKIRVKPANNPRKKSARAGIARLAHNIAKRGLQQPVTVRPITEDGLEEGDAFELVFGYRRHAAIGYAMLQGWLPEDDDVICIVRRLNDSQARLAALTENEEREEVDKLDIAEGWARLRLTQSESSIANAAGVTLTEVRRCLKVAFGVCDEAKMLYRAGNLSWAALINLTYGSQDLQRQYLEGAAGATWKLSPEYVRQGMTATDFKLAHARFTLEEYEAAGGQLETDLWSSREGTRLLSQPVIERLQQAWAQDHVKALQDQGFAFVELRSGEWTWWSEFSQVARGTESAGAVVHLRPDWSVDVIEHIVPSAAIVGSRMAVAAGTSDGSSAATVSAAEPKSTYSEAGVTLTRRLRTAALQSAILENRDPKLPLALAVMGFLGERELRMSVKLLGETDAISSTSVLAELERFAQRLPHLRFSPSSGLSLGSVYQHGSARLEILQGLLNLPQSDLERLHRLLISTMIGDFSAATDGNPQGRKRSLKVDGLIAALAAHLEVKGGEALEVTEVYLKAISFRKAKLRPYLAHAFGEQIATALLESPKAKIIAELLTHKDKLAGFTPPELDFAANAGQTAKLEVNGGAFDDWDDDEPLETGSNLVSEDDLDSLEPELEALAADD